MKKRPTKAQVRAAKKAIVKAHAVLRRHYGRPKRHRMVVRLRVMSPAQRRFRMWTHDFNTMLQAFAMGDALTPGMVAERAAQEADRMNEIIDGRRPSGGDGTHYVHGFRKSKQWERIFDDLIHTMVKVTSMNARDVVTRASSIADLAEEVIREHRQSLRKKKSA